MNYVIAKRSFLIGVSIRHHMPLLNNPVILRRCLDELLESTVEGRSEGLDVLVVVNGELRALGNTLGGEFKLL
jgi:hypothetical protein